MASQADKDTAAAKAKQNNNNQAAKDTAAAKAKQGGGQAAIDTAAAKAKQNGGDGGTSERMSQREAAAGLNNIVLCCFMTFSNFKSKNIFFKT